MGAFPNLSRPEMSRFVPVCPLLSFLGPGTGTNRDKRGQTGTKRDISGQIGKRPHLASTPPPNLALLKYRAIPFRDSIAEGGIAPICLVFIGYRAGIAEIQLLRGGYRTSTSHALQGGKRSERGRGYRIHLAMLRHQKPHSAQ